MIEHKKLRTIIKNTQRDFSGGETKGQKLKNKKMKQGYELAIADVLDRYDVYVSTIVEDEKLFMTEAFGYKTKVVNEYHTKITVEDPKRTYDWYHTTGKLLRKNKLIGESYDGDEISNMIEKDLTNVA